jgi:hypothetical protein
MRGSRDTNAYQSVAAQANGKFEISRSPVGAHLRHAPAGRSLLIGRQRTVFASHVRCKWNLGLYGIVRPAGKETDADLSTRRVAQPRMVISATISRLQPARQKPK